MKKGRQKFCQFTLAAVIAFPLVGAIIYYGKLAILGTQMTSTPLMAGHVLPPEFTQLVVTEGGERGLEIRGVYRAGGDEVHFITARGARISVFERASGAGAFEVDACFTKDGRALVAVAGGHAVTIPECRALAGEMSGGEDSASSAPEDMQLAYDAMRAIAKLPFRHEYELEQRALTGTLAFSVIAGSLDGS